MAKIFNLFIFTLVVVLIYIQETLSQLDGTAATENNKVRRVSEIKCDEYYRNLLQSFAIPIPPTSYDILNNRYPRSKREAIQKRQVSSDLRQVSPSAGPSDLPFPPPGIVGGQTTTVGEFPHMVAIGWSKLEGGFTFSCGGALISPRHVLTAAHCTYAHTEADPFPSVVRIGDQNIDSSVDDGAKPVEVSIKAILNHPEYTRRKNYNDVAILELANNVNFTRRIQPACLWTTGHLGPHTEAVATGWGVVHPETGETAKDLQKVTLKILNNDYCNKTLNSIINRKWERGFDDTQLCAGEPQGGKDTCQGDSGSPLQVVTKLTPPRYFVIGVTSFGPRICAKLPAVYTRVSSYLDWIEKNVWAQEFQAAPLM